MFHPQKIRIPSSRVNCGNQTRGPATGDKQEECAAHGLKSVDCLAEIRSGDLFGGCK
jgi:hypothetical protein